MPFALTDLKRAYGRSGVRAGPPDVRPYLLAGAELAAQMPKLRAAIAWHEAQCGRRRAEIDLDELAQVVGDYRLARCLGACLQGTYRYAADDFEAAVVGEGGPGGRARWTRLQERGVASPSALRLHVYDRVQAARGGFVPPAERQEVMASVAADLLLDPEHLDRLMRLDAEENERLTRLEPPPSPEALAAEYNRRALATLLGRAISADLLLPQPDGAALRRFYFLVKRNGLLCELSLPQPAHLIPNPSPRSAPFTAIPSPSRGEGDAAGRPRTKTPPLPWRERGRGGEGTTRAGRSTAGIQAHLFGPLEVFGPRTRHGDRFARVVLALLRRFEGLSGEVLVLLNEREYHLRLDAGVRGALPVASSTPWPCVPADDGEGAPETGATEAVDEAAPADALPGAVVAGSTSGESFDSAVEERLFVTLRGMERRDDTRGWHFEREPEPIVHDGTVLIPDFAARRATRGGAAGAEPGERVFVEVIGFWTPAYRERKRAKLRHLAGSVPLALVVQEQLASDFADLPFPVLAYKQRPSAADLVRLLGRHFDRADQRRAAARDGLADALTPADAEAGIVDEPALRRRLGLTSAGEVTQVLSNGAALPAEWRFVPGVGLCHRNWLARFRAWCEAAFAAQRPEQAPALEALRCAVVASGLPAAAAAANHLENLLPAAGFEVVWQSLFDAVVQRRQ